MKQIKLSKKLLEELKAILSKYDEYGKFSKYKKDAYKYTSLFKISVCPFCNINYIPTIDDVTRPEFDHFIAQKSKDGNNKKLDANNLVPSCHTCNCTLKLAKEFTNETHLHPFEENFDEIMKFAINMTGGTLTDCNDFEIVFTPIAKNECLISKARKNIEVFKLLERYANHKKSVLTHFKFLSYYGKRKRQEVFELLRDTEKEKTSSKNTDKEIYILNTLVRNVLNLDINTTSLGKLTKDIYQSYLKNL